jgi:hypothetical protein
MNGTDSHLRVKALETKKKGRKICEEIFATGRSCRLKEKR